MLDPKLISLAQRAWEIVKDPSQPSWNDCTASHRQKYLTAAKAAIKTGVAHTIFDRRVLELNEPPPSITIPAAPRPFDESNYAMPHSEFMNEKAERDAVLAHGDEEMAAQAGVSVDQHETEGASVIGQPPTPDAKKPPTRKSSKKSAAKKGAKK